MRKSDRTARCVALVAGWLALAPGHTTAQPRGEARAGREPQDSLAASGASDQYAWRLFVALNGPADPPTRGAGPTTSPGADPRTVWESWAGANEVFLDDGSDPGPWRDRAAGNVLPATLRFETQSLRDLPNLRRVVDGRVEAVVDPLAVSRRLTEIRLNRSSYEYIRAHELYSLDGQRRAFRSRTRVEFPADAKQVKAQWRAITEADRPRYHTVEVTLADGRHQLYGLIALHVATKDLPHWFWATFEHVDNPGLPDNEGWQIASRDRFACAAERPDCNRAPAGLGLEGTVWQYYRLRGTLTDYLEPDGRPARLANSELETGLQGSASCMTCHARAAIAVLDDKIARLPILDESTAAAPGTRRGFVGTPDRRWFVLDSDDSAPVEFMPLDFVWSLGKAHEHAPR